jgi:mRNA-degrading endonuclease toxin of MazEF toxin-antitoxin module
LPLPEPRPGLVISYAYLWAEEREADRDEGVKDRPCVIVLAVESSDADTIVAVVPITHTPPVDPSFCIEIPAATKRRLGLDSEKSWAVANQVNRFVWPGFDLRPVSRHEPDRFAYGYLPPMIFKRITETLFRAARSRRAAIVSRE